MFRCINEKEVQLLAIPLNFCLLTGAENGTQTRDPQLGRLLTVFRQIVITYLLSVIYFSILTCPFALSKHCQNGQVNSFYTFLYVQIARFNVVKFNPINVKFYKKSYNPSILG